jgi:hypothetical protein
MGSAHAVDGEGAAPARPPERAAWLARVQAAARIVRRGAGRLAWQLHGVNASLQRPLLARAAGAAVAAGPGESPARAAPDA